MLFLGGSHEETNQENVGDERANLRHWVSPPTIGDRRLDATKLEQCADYAHQGSTGNETTGDECTLLATFAVHLGILAARGDIPLTAPPTKRGTFNSNGMNIPRANARAGILK